MFKTGFPSLVALSGRWGKSRYPGISAALGEDIVRLKCAKWTRNVYGIVSWDEPLLGEVGVQVALALGDIGLNLRLSCD